MSALTPHIRVLRALAAVFATQTDIAKRGSAVAWEIMDGIQSAIACAADALEASEPSLPDDEHPITYNPKGKR